MQKNISTRMTAMADIALSSAELLAELLLLLLILPELPPIFVGAGDPEGLSVGALEACADGTHSVAPFRDVPMPLPHCEHNDTPYEFENEFKGHKSHVTEPSRAE